MLCQEGQLAAEAAKGEHAALQVNGAGMAPADSRDSRVQGLLCEVSHIASPCSRLWTRNWRVLCQQGLLVMEIVEGEHAALQVNGAGMAPADSKDRMLPLACSDQGVF